MYKFLFLILVFSCSYISEAQTIKGVDTTYYRYDKSKGSIEKSNYYAVKTTNDDGSVAAKEYFRFTVPHRLKATYKEDAAGSKEGAYAFYNKDGFISEEGYYRGNEKDGLIIFYRDGMIQRKVPFVNGSQDGLAYYFFRGKKIYEWTWKNGASEGYNESTYENGNMRFKGTYVNGTLKGISSKFHKNGSLKSLINYKNGRGEGACSSYHKNGLLFSEGNFKEGRQTGTWKWYREDGSFASNELYSNNGRLKKITFYDADGNELKTKKRDALKGVLNDKKELHKNIQKHMNNAFNFPEILRNNGFEARVFVSFKIDKNGAVVDIKTRSDAHPSFDIEAENLIRILPKQAPAFAHNVLVDASFAFPLVFKIVD